MYSSKRKIRSNEIKQQVNIECIAQVLNNLIIKNKISTKVLSKATGISIPALNNLKRGEGNPTLGTLNTLASFFNISLTKLLGISEFEGLNTSHKLNVVSVYDIREAHKRFDNALCEKILVDIASKTNHSSLFGISINNNSLLPFYEKGTVFILSSEYNLTDGDIIFVKIKNNFNSLKRFFRKNNLYLLKSLNLDPTDELYKPNEVEILGTAIQIIQNIN